MKKCLLSFILMLSILFSTQGVFACNEQQTNTLILQILFGDNVYAHESDSETQMLLSALYLCSEQCDRLGQDKITFLKSQRVSGIPAISRINISSDVLQDCSHNAWEHIYSSGKKIQSDRKKILQNTVNKVFDFGLFNNLFGKSSGKCNSFSALLFYSHILSDYLAADPEDTEVVVKGREIAPFSGDGFTIINGGIPSFSNEEKQLIASTIDPGELDKFKRCGTVFAVIGKDSMSFVGPRPLLPDPVGWKTDKYADIVNGESLYNRCHLVARQFCGVDNEHNLITGTKYLNDTMGMFEGEVADYIKSHNENHVLYRVTPIYQADNIIASGVQMEAYSVEDSGRGVSFNVYCYNVQPGIDINYMNGDSELVDKISGSDRVIPFAIYSPSDSKSDLIYEINKHLEILFDDQKDSSDYIGLMNQLSMIAAEARSVGFSGKSVASNYAAMKKYEYQYVEALKNYVPKLLKNEDFFKSAFN